ncbi:MAG: hypothetical protein MZV64_62620 [Ignavibacteriales bacterium]|nr:hypothetical protein [Ignavibacteriales bacterium]
MALGYSSAGHDRRARRRTWQASRSVSAWPARAADYAVHAEYNVVPRNLLTPLPE